jgi:thioredoxin reductase (NADPH)
MNHTVEEILGDNYVSGIRIKNNETGEEETLETDGVLIAIGWLPNTELFKNQLPRNSNGYIKSNGVMTGKPGVFLAGDINDYAYRQLVTACGSGCKAALETERYLDHR